MNWEAIGAIAETLGAIGVIASLVYLAGQIRQSRDQMERNTRAMQAGTYQEFIQGLHTTIMDAMKVPDLEPAVRVGMLDFEQLSEEDAFRFNFWVRGILVSWENAHYQYRTGMLEENRWQMQRHQVEELLDNPGVVQWWRAELQGSEFLGPEFTALVKEILAEEPDRGDEVGHVSVGAS